MTHRPLGFIFLSSCIFAAQLFPDELVLSREKKLLSIRRRDHSFKKYFHCVIDLGARGKEKEREEDIYAFTG